MDSRVGLGLVILLVVTSLIIPRYDSPFHNEFTASDFSGCLRHEITNSSEAGSGFQLVFNINRGIGSSSGNNVFTQCEDDFRDIRFISSTGKSLPYWIEEIQYGVSAKVWVRITSSDSELYLLSGNPEASSKSNGYDVFDIFSDFRKYFDDVTWSYFTSGDAKVFSPDISSRELPWLFNTEVEGMAYDGEYFYISTAKTIDGRGNASLYKVTKSGLLVDSVFIQEGTLTHAGGIALYNDSLWIPLSERSSTPSNPSKVLRYSLDLEFIDIWQDSSELNNAHWGAIGIIPEIETVYLSDFGTSDVYVYDIEGDFIDTITDPPDSSIQSWIAIDGFLCGGQSGYGSNDVAVWEVTNKAGTELRRRGVLTTESGRTQNALTWSNGSWWSCSDSFPTTIYEMRGENLSLEISNYYIASRQYVQPNHTIECLLKSGGNQAFNFGFASSWPASSPQIIGHAFNGSISLYDGSVDSGILVMPVGLTRLNLNWGEGFAQLCVGQETLLNWTSPTIASHLLNAGVQLWGTANEPLYLKWIFVRAWKSSPPTHGVWEEAQCPTIVSTLSTSPTTSSQIPPNLTGLIITVGVLVILTVTITGLAWRRYRT